MKETMNMNNETINNTIMEDETMRNINEETVVTNEEVTMGQKAKVYVESKRPKLMEMLKWAIENIDGVKELVIKISNMTPEQLEKEGEKILNEIINKINIFHKDMEEESELFPFLKEDAKKSMNIIILIKDVIDEKGIKGWGKFKAIVKEIISWLLRLLLKVGTIVLKLGLVVVVGTIKIGATALVTTGKAVGVINKEVIEPTIKAWANYKDKRAFEFEDEEDEFEDEEDEFEEIREELDLN